MKRILKKVSWKKLSIWLVVIVVLIVAVNSGIQRMKTQYASNMAGVEEVSTAPVETRDIQTVLSSSGTIQPLNTYEITTLVEGEIIAADFEEGDTVEEGQVLYQVATDNLDNQIETFQTAVDRAEKNYTKAQESYEDAQADYEEASDEYREAMDKYGLTDIKAEENGIIKTLYVEEGDTVQAGTQIAQIYDNSSMLLVLPFPASEVDKYMVGKSAEVIIESTDETLEGVVTKVSSIDEALTGNRLVNQVTIQVKNPGALTTTTSATAAVGDVYSSADGTFLVLTDTVIKAEIAGEIGILKVEEGSKVKSDDIIYILTDKSIENQLENYKSKVENAQDMVENANDNVDDAREAIEDAEADLADVHELRTDYSITAPISGKIISKNALVGDTIKSNSVNNSLCVVYDLSAVTFEMSVDELDVKNVKVGQEVEIVADAYEEVTYYGIVTNISLQSSTNQGVTQYPVTVKIAKVGDLLPGMNVTGEIIIEKVEGVIAIPSDALMRGNVVYVEDSAVTEAVGDVPSGFREVPVETGISDGDYVEVISGLSGNETVYVQRKSEAISMMFPEGNMDFQYQEGAEIRSEGPVMQRSTTVRGGARSSGQ